MSLPLLYIDRANLCSGKGSRLLLLSVTILYSGLLLGGIKQKLFQAKLFWKLSFSVSFVLYFK